MNFPRQAVWAVLSLIVCLCSTSLHAQTLIDPLNLAVIPSQTHMDRVGWPILAGRNGGWGRFPDSYSYQRVEIDGTACVIDSYPHSQTHGSSNAIMLDWDGDPSNGNTALKPIPGMKLTFKVSVYMQPWAHNGGKKYWVRDGAGMVLWQMGPGIVPADYKPIKDIKKDQPDYSWLAGRGPRIGYYTGEVPGYEPAKMPVIQAYLPQEEKPSVQLPLTEAKQWVDLKLTVQLADDLKSASCRVNMKPATEDKWVNVGEAWSFPLEMTSDSVFNPAQWNALILDMPHTIWAPKGYGKPDPSIVDRYRGFAVSVSHGNLNEQAQRSELMRFERKTIAARMPVPKRVFAGQSIAVPLEVVNAGKQPLKGTLLLTVGDKQQTLASNWTLGIDEQWRMQQTLETTMANSEVSLEFSLKQPDGQLQSLVKTNVQVIASTCPTPMQNVMRNASFELPAMFCGSAMRQGYERFYSFAKYKDQRLWTELPIEGWWAQGDDASGMTVDLQQFHSGKQSLKLVAGANPVAVVSTPGSWLPQGDVTVSAWVKTKQAKAELQLDLLTSDEPILARRANLRKVIDLPADSDWTRVTMTVSATSIMQALTRIIVEQGSVWVDDVQVQGAAQASTFDLRPAEQVRLELPTFDDATLPKWVTGDQQLRTLTLHFDGCQSQSGYVTVAIGTWDKPATQPIGRVDLSQLQNGEPVKLSFPTVKMVPNAYVITADLHLSDQTVYAGVDQFDSTTRLGGSTSNSMMRSRQALCFAMIPDYEPAKIFGVGNGMLDTNGDHFGGYRIEDYQWAGQLDYVCDRGRYNAPKGYLIAAGGLPTHRMESLRLYRDASKNPSIQNPAVPGVLDLANPLAQEQFIKQARKIGRENGSNPQIASYQMANERPFYARDGLCPTVAADADFRQWCQQRHGDLTTLNKHWRTSYTTWEQVEQPLSAGQLQTVMQQEQLKGAAATAWTAVYGKMSKQVHELMQSIPGRGLDWYRWRTAFSLRMYEQFRNEAKKFDSKTLYSTNLCWPNFWPQMAMRFFRAMDVTMLDLEYTAGQFRGLGTPSEMMEIMEMFESNAPGKPMWGIEVYTQPQWPAASTALQNWGLLAHGMTNNLVFGWRPYSDHGRVKGTRAWEKDDAHPMWFIIDNDGTKLPSFDAVEKTKHEIQAFHKQYDGLSLKRYPTHIAIYVSDDTSEYLSYATANKPYATNVTHARNTLIYLMRLAGLQADYLDDQLLTGKLTQYDTLILPPTPLLSDAAAQQIATFVQAGGKLILAGAAGQFDPWLNARPMLGGKAWQTLNWQAEDYQYKSINAASNLNGMNVGQVAAGRAIMDKQGQLLGWQKAWGKGTVFAMGVYPCVYNKNPHVPMEAAAWMQRVIDEAALPVTARWANDEAVQVQSDEAHGMGAAVVEVVLRRKSQQQVFAFVLNQGGDGKGQVYCHLPMDSGSWQVHDALSGQVMDATTSKDGVRVPMTMPAWGYRVLLLSR